MAYYIFRLCRNSGGWEILPKRFLNLDLHKLAKKFEKIDVESNAILTVEVEGVKASIFKSGRILLFDCEESRGEEIGGKIFRTVSGDTDRSALFVGRFQPFHMGHFKVIQDILKGYESLSVVIGGPDGKPTAKNPFSFSERKDMISESLEAAGMEADIRVLKDVNDDRKWSETIRSLGSFDAAFTRNSWTARCLKSIGIPVKKQKNYERYKHCGTKIRQRILKGEDWRDLVPEKVYEYVRKIDGEERIRKL